MYSYICIILYLSVYIHICIKEPSLKFKNIFAQFFAIAFVAFFLLFEGVAVVVLCPSFFSPQLVLFLGICGICFGFLGFF